MRYERLTLTEIYLLVCYADYKTRGFAHETPPFSLENIIHLYIRLVNRLLWAMLHTTGRIHTYTHTHTTHAHIKGLNAHAHLPKAHRLIFRTIEHAPLSSVTRRFIM